MMRVLHSADWHLGARLVERERLPEQRAFLQWLVQLLVERRVDLLLVSGDVFDVANPPQDALHLYYDFLEQVTRLCPALEVVVTGGNHDSASLLNAPRELLRRSRVHVFGAAPVSAAECLVDVGGAVVAAVPFLRERDLRESVPGEVAGSAAEAVQRGIQAHYAGVLAVGRELSGGRPLLAMGHLTVIGAVTSDSEREVHIGNLGGVGADVFAGFDYVALGHLHRPQKVAGQWWVRYSGAPVALSFSEAGDEKSVVLLDLDENGLREPELVAVPQGRLLKRVKVKFEEMAEKLVSQVPEGCWAEVTVLLEKPVALLDQQVKEVLAGHCEVLKVVSSQPEGQSAPWEVQQEDLGELNPREVFERCVVAQGVVTEGEDGGLMGLFAELLAEHEKRRLA